MTAKSSAAIKQIDTIAFDKLTQAAQDSSRLRINHNLHSDFHSQVQRMVVAMEPGTYVKPHRHSHKWETLLPLRGSFSVVIFDKQGNETERFILGTETGLHLVEVPSGVWHSVAARESGSILFEVKEGPYTPITPADSAIWAPEDGTPEAEKFVSYVAGI
jgi:cupin fold WbuC family metalloprotein